MLVHWRDCLAYASGLCMAETCYKLMFIRYASPLVIFGDIYLHKVVKTYPPYISGR